jgi:cell division protein ZapE
MMDGHFARLTGGARAEPRVIVSKSRRIVVPRAVDGVARFSFADLCSRALGAADYLRIAAAFHTILLEDVPLFEAAQRSEARRLILLIDTLYDNRIRLIVSAAGEPDRLWAAMGLENFEVARAASRLFEMRSDAYWRTAASSGAQKKTARTG